MKFHKIIVSLRSLDTTTIIANSALSTTLAMYHLMSTHGMIGNYTAHGENINCTWTVSWQTMTRKLKTKNQEDGKKHFRHSAKNSKLNMMMFTLLLFT